MTGRCAQGQQHHKLVAPCADAAANLRTPDATHSWHVRADRLRTAAGVLLAMFVLLLSGCHKKVQRSRNTYPAPPPVRRSPSAGEGSARRTPTPAPPSRTVPRTDDNAVPTGRVETGLASWYAPSGHRSANGDVYDGNSLTAAHRTLPLGTLLRVTNLATGQTVDVRVTDRGPFVRGRVLDLSTAAAKASGVYRMGVARVSIEILQMRPDVSPTGRWCVQVGAFVDQGNADRLRADLSRQYSTSAKVIEFAGATGMWVRINPVSSDRAHATAIAQSIRVAEPDAQAYLVRLD
ncbi:septal ring lytic transglycosylase RlpA family protein [Terriglobus aquaticus]|uniref:Probable endolytic peptidoglycan transglycosylase RlpA n=1 Tax=Terriglobus aquaticus TaxID=940139 RepID=A0ABW9KFQ8_9BACT|nr:septal ring lytic transglycosylase RlpA family protein [Terriglobus aquaticus]